jgi:uncharacterized phage protein (TIGR02218 family)
MSDLWLAGPLTSAAYGWRLERADGVTLGFTSHDKDVVHQGLLLRASPGMKPTTIVESLGFDNDGLDVSGALTSDSIRAADLMAGRWDRAYVEIFLFDWTNPDAGRRLLAAGELGTISFSNDDFEAEFRGLKQILDRSIVPQTSPSCRASFCDLACGLNRERFRHPTIFREMNASRLLLDMPAGIQENGFAYGIARWLDGPNSGLSFDIMKSDSTGITSSQLLDYWVRTGDRIEIVEGCDKQIGTCASRFANAINFRGEPYLPGNDLLTRYPGAN